MLRRLIVCSSLLLLAVPSVAHGQWDPGASAMLGQGYGQNALSQSVMTNTFNSTGGSSKPKAKAKTGPKRATKAQLAKLRFTPTAARTQANAAEISQILLASCPPERTGCPLEHASIIATGIDSGDHRVRFADNVQTLARGSDRNVADAVTTFITMAWLAQRPTLDLTTAQKQGIRASAGELRNQLALDAKVRRLSDARKQRLVETLASIAQHTLALRHAYTQIARQDEADKLTRYFRDVTDKLTSIDVTDLRLSRKGFAER